MLTGNVAGYYKFLEGMSAQQQEQALETIRRVPYMKELQQLYGSDMAHLSLATAEIRATMLEYIRDSPDEYHEFISSKLRRRPANKIEEIRISHELYRKCMVIFLEGPAQTGRIDGPIRIYDTKRLAQLGVRAQCLLCLRKDQLLQEKEAVLAEREEIIAEKDRLIAHLQALVAQLQCTPQAVLASTSTQNISRFLVSNNNSFEIGSQHLLQFPQAPRENNSDFSNIDFSGVSEDVYVLRSNLFDESLRGDSLAQRLSQLTLGVEALSEMNRHQLQQFQGLVAQRTSTLRGQALQISLEDTNRRAQNEYFRSRRIPEDSEQRGAALAALQRNLQEEYQACRDDFQAAIGIVENLLRASEGARDFAQIEMRVRLGRLNAKVNDTRSAAALYAEAINDYEALLRAQQQRLSHVLLIQWLHELSAFTLTPEEQAFAIALNARVYEEMYDQLRELRASNATAAALRPFQLKLGIVARTALQCGDFEGAVAAAELCVELIEADAHSGYRAGTAMTLQALALEQEGEFTLAENLLLQQRKQVLQTFGSGSVEDLQSLERCLRASKSLSGKPFLPQIDLEFVQRELANTVAQVCIPAQYLFAVLHVQSYEPASGVLLLEQVL